MARVVVAGLVGVSLCGCRVNRDVPVSTASARTDNLPPQAKQAMDQARDTAKAEGQARQTPH